MSKISLKTLLVPSKSTTVDFPGFDGFTVDVSFLSREELVKIRKKATKTTFKPRQGTTEEFDEELFLKFYVENSIKGWAGLKLAIVNQLAPIDMSGQNPDDEIEFDSDTALMLMKASADFDAFISSTVSDLSVFTKDSGNK